MIHIITVHWQDDRWVDIQLKYLEKFINSPYKVYAFLNGLPRDHGSKYFYSSTEKIRSHPTKLNLLADMVALHSDSEDDWLIFIDGDAFPIGDIVPFARDKLKEYPLLAIQRLENCGDIQPHPCFCLTTVKFWKEIKGDWHSGYEWQDALGRQVTDVGGNLLGTLEEKKIKWLPLIRSNVRDLHELWFGIYGDLVYHHGAGFRTPMSRSDLQQISDDGNPIINMLLNVTGSTGFNRFLTKMSRRKGIEANTMLGEKVYQSILSDTNFYRVFQEPESSEKGLGKAVTLQ
jgi:hypothetical protein